MILSGTKVAQNIYQELEEKISQNEKKPCLGAILVGENSASIRYIGQKKKYAEKVGMGFKLTQLDKNISEEGLVDIIIQLNNSDDISAYMIQLPLPKHINTNKIISYIAPGKDADGFHPINMGKLCINDTSNPLLPCTPSGIMKIFEHYNISLSGKRVCVIGRSNIVGKPMALLCINAGATVTSCNSQTKNLRDITLQSDIIVCATGQKHLLKADMVHSNVVIIDVGFHVEEGKIYGDCDTKTLDEKGCQITPVPGGVGPMTVAMLLYNTSLAQYGHEKK